MPITEAYGREIQGARSEQTKIALPAKGDLTLQSWRCRAVLTHLSSHDVENVSGGGVQLGGGKQREVLHQIVGSLCKHGLIPAGVALYALHQVRTLLTWVELQHGRCPPWSQLEFTWC
jgi:hypothetical protein